jgi:demethoxyubiquinone hydroxylase (CLK1/Coq7/Cat5 family)
MTEEKTESQIRNIIEALVTDGSQDHINTLSKLLQKKDADPSFLRDLFGRLSYGQNNLFRSSS